MYNQSIMQQYFPLNLTCCIPQAIPIMNEALAALDTIKEADINYIKKLGNPPGAIKLVLEAVCVILDAKPAKVKDESGKMVNDYWKPSVALMNEKVC